MAEGVWIPAAGVLAAVGVAQHSIHIAHVASVSIDTNLLFANVLIETSGGATPVTCHGHRKGDAVRMKRLIEHYQTQYYRASADGGRRRADLSAVALAKAEALGEGGQPEVVRG